MYVFCKVTHNSPFKTNISKLNAIFVRNYIKGCLGFASLPMAFGGYLGFAPGNAHTLKTLSKGGARRGISKQLELPLN